MKRVSSFIFSILVGEVILRIVAPNLGSDLFENPAKREPPFFYNETVGYEFKPFAWVETVDDQGKPILERLNREGFRGRGHDHSVEKPQGVFRILAVGDSVVQAPGPYGDTWEHVLEEALNHHTTLSGGATRYEVINSGVGGYVSWQALIRLKERGLKYQPDIVLVLVGWNDLIFSSLDDWHPRRNLTDIERAYLNQPPPQDRIVGHYSQGLISVFLCRTADS